MAAIAVYSPSGSSGELQFANSSGLFDAAGAFWDSTNSKLYISGNLEVLGTETVVDTQHLQIEDSIIGLGTGSAGEGAAADRGIIFLIDSETNPSIFWDESADEFRLARLTNVPGNNVFNDPEAAGEGGYQSLKLGTLKAKTGAIFDGRETDLSSIGSDAFLFVSGTTGKRGTTKKGLSIFGGDVVISGTLFGGSPLKLGGEVEFISEEGASTSIKNPSGSVEVFARDEVKIGSATGLVKLIDLGGSRAGVIFLTGSAIQEDRRLKFLTKGQVHFHGKNPNEEINCGSDMFLFLSGAKQQNGRARESVTVLGGDTIVSGTLIVDGLGITGSLTKLKDGSDYLSPGYGMTLSTGSNGSISITSVASTLFRKSVHVVGSSVSALSTIAISNIDFTLVGLDENRIDIFVNGQLMAPGVSKDYVLAGDSNGVKFYFNLIIGDIITVRTY